MVLNLLENDYEKTIKQEGIVVVKFSRDNCKFCDQMVEDFKKVAEDHPDIKFYSVHNNHDLLVKVTGDKRGITPTTIFYKNGVEFKRIAKLCNHSVLTRALDDVHNATEPDKIEAAPTNDIRVMDNVKLQAYAYTLMKRRDQLVEQLDLVEIELDRRNGLNV
jgi:hypothetical protein